MAGDIGRRIARPCVRSLTSLGVDAGNSSNLLSGPSGTEDLHCEGAKLAMSGDDPVEQQLRDVRESQAVPVTVGGGGAAAPWELVLEPASGLV